MLTAHEKTDALTLQYVALSSLSFWKRNPKSHDHKGIAASIRKHGFKDPLKWEPQLNNGLGGVVEGNGRLLALQQMFEVGATVPRGVGYDEEGNWYVPVLFGVDAPSRLAAEAYGIDHNNITVAGGDYSWNDRMKMWEAPYVNLVLELAMADELPASLDGDDVDRMARALEKLTPPQDSFAGEGEGDLSALNIESQSVFRVVWIFETSEGVAEFWRRLRVEPSPGRELFRWTDLVTMEGDCGLAE